MKQLITIAAVGLAAALLTTQAQAQAPKAQSKPAAAATKAPAKAAAPKFTAAQIKDAQTGLQKAGLYKGKITGVWSASTIKAYKEWEKANNMPEDGKLTDEALAKLKTA